MGRDERLGAALRELPVPEHGPGFWERLETALEGEAPARPAPRRSRRPVRRRVGLALAAAAAATVAVVIGLPNGESPERALADEVTARVREAIEGLEDIRGQGVWRFRNDPPVRFSFALTADGDALLRQPGFTAAYDSGRGIERQIIGSDSPRAGALYVERRGVAPGPPDLTPTEIPAREQLGAAIRALLAADDPRVTEAAWRGREAWRAVIPAEPNETFSDIDRLLVIVDRETGLPVRIRGSRDGRPVYDTRVERLEVNSGSGEDTFRLRFPPRAEVSINREGFERVTLADSGAMAGYDPLVPTWVPEGYELAEVAVAERDRFTGSAPESGKANPRGFDVVSLAYRRGFDQLTVTTRRVGEPAEDWTDPFRATDVPEELEPVRLSDGALAGAEAEVVVGPQALPHLWALDDGLAVTVAGNLSRDELLSVAESLAAD